MTDKHTGRVDAGGGEERRLVVVGPLGGRTAVPDGLAGQVDELVGRFAERLQEGVLAASVAIGLEVLDELMRVEVAGLAGPKGRHDPYRTCKRHGSEDGSVILGGRRVAVRRPRVRTADDTGEARLETYEEARASDLLAEHMVGAMLAGLSTRRYGAALEPVGDATVERSSATSKSAVSRRFVTATTDRLGELMGRRLDAERWPVVFVDGFGFAEHQLVGALGVSEDGAKVPLAVMEGTTENKALVTRLLADLQDRGLDVSKGILFVVDGSKALTRGIPAVFGPKALIQRCRIHKERNVLDHLPDAEHSWVRRKLRAAWANPDPDAAQAELEALARALQRKHPGAAGSLREGLAETLTVTRLGISGSLLKTVFSTNPVESMIQIVREHSANVKRWRDGEMVLRWAAAGMEAARSQFRRIKGYRQLPQLAAALEQATAHQPGLADLRATA
ncbi:MAG: IS256 family transposase [Actinomycetota bacterium]